MGRFGISPVGIRGEYDGRSTHLTFEIRLDLSKPDEVLINDELIEKENTPLAA